MTKQTAWGRMTSHVQQPGGTKTEIFVRGPERWALAFGEGRK
jgi:hypothetical protein